MVAQDDAVYILELISDVIIAAFVRTGSKSVHTKPRVSTFSTPITKGHHPKSDTIVGEDCLLLHPAWQGNRKFA